MSRYLCLTRYKGADLRGVVRIRIIRERVIRGFSVDSFLRLAASLSSPSLSRASLSLSLYYRSCHCSTSREHDFPRYSLPTILLHATSAISSHLLFLSRSLFLCRLLSVVCQPSTPPCFSRVLARSGGGGSRRW